MLAAGWYGQGLRLLDISDARSVRQVGYFRVATSDPANPTSNSWDVAIRSDRSHRGKRDSSDLVYLFDMARGVEILRLEKGAKAAAKMKRVTAPSLRKGYTAAQPVSSLVSTGDPNRFVCPLFE